ncbi:unnamed protein product [Diamesa serratosioi]
MLQAKVHFLIWLVTICQSTAISKINFVEVSSFKWKIVAFFKKGNNLTLTPFHFPYDAEVFVNMSYTSSIFTKSFATLRLKFYCDVDCSLYTETVIIFKKDIEMNYMNNECENSKIVSWPVGIIKMSGVKNLLFLQTSHPKYAVKALLVLGRRLLVLDEMYVMKQAIRELEVENIIYINTTQRNSYCRPNKVDAWKNVLVHTVTFEDLGIYYNCNGMRNTSVLLLLLNKDNKQSEEDLDDMIKTFIFNFYPHVQGNFDINSLDEIHDDKECQEYLDVQKTPPNMSPEMASMFENFNKKGSMSPSATTAAVSVPTNGLVSRQNLLNSSLTNASSLKSSQQVLNSTSSSSSRISKSQQSSSQSRLHHISQSTSSSSTSSQQLQSTTTSSSEMKAHALKRDLNEIKNSMSEINNLAAIGRTNQMNELQKRIRSSMENLVDDPESEGLVTVTFPDDPPNDDLQLDLSPSCLTEELTNGQLQTVGNGITSDTVKFEQKRMTSATKTKVLTNGYSSEQATSNSAEVKKLQAGDVEYKEANAVAAMRNRLEIDGVMTEQNAALLQEARSLKAGDFQQQDSNNVSASCMKVQSEQFSAEKRAVSKNQQRQVLAGGIYNQEQHHSQASQVTINSSRSIVTSSQTNSSSCFTGNGHFMDEEMLQSFEDLERLCSSSNPQDVEETIMKYSQHLNACVKQMSHTEVIKRAPNVLDKINEIIRRAWAVPTHGHELGASLCNALKQNGGLDLLMRNCMDGDKDLQFSSARLLEQCLTTENRSHVVENGLEKVVNVACVCTRNTQTDHSRVGTGILEHLFKHSEGTCSDVIRLGGLDAVLFECRKNDVETLRHCAGALANLSLYGGAENQEAMINRKVPMWLFPLAFHDDDNIKYYACLAIAVLVANKEIEAEVLKSGTLDLVEPFVTSHNPYEFGKSNLAHAHGQSKHWLQRLVPVLSSKREEARNLAAFHFCMEAGIKKQQGNTEIFREINAIEPLKKVASCPNAIASKFAAQALRLIGEQVPHKLSQQVPLWSTEDVREWVKQIGFVEYEHNFYDSKVDGDLLLQLNEQNLCEDIGIANGIRRKRFERELQNLKKMADYSSRDASSLNNFLLNIGPEYSIYTYSMLNAGVDKDSLRNLNDDQLIVECGIKNSIHRMRILNILSGLEQISSTLNEDAIDKTLDVFVSYRRSNGSQLASLLKVHLQLRGFSVFIDVERLEAGKFDNNLLQSIKQAKNFLLVLTPSALERCMEDVDGKDWVHREIVAALNSNCNIIPIIDNFQWPAPEMLPEDMRSLCHFNAVRWIHDYQDACVDKLERFMRGELNMRNDYRGPLSRTAGSDITTPSTPGTASSMRQNPPVYQRMHSNDSGKGNDSSKDPTNSPLTVEKPPSQAAPKKYLNNFSNRFRRSSNPTSRQQQLQQQQQQQYSIGNPRSAGIAGHLPSSRNYRHPNASTAFNRYNGHNIRNSSLPPLPPTISARSHSLDGLLETNPKTNYNTKLLPNGNGGLNDKSQTTGEGKLNAKNQIADHKSRLCADNLRNKDSMKNQSANRRSKSLDDLLDNDGSLLIDENVDLDDQQHNQSMENLLENTGKCSKNVSTESFICNSVSPVPSEQPCENETMTVDNSRMIESLDDNDSSHNDSGIQCDPDDATPKFQSDNSSFENDDTISNTISMASSVDPKDPERKGNKTFLNKYVKKVKNLMKK